MNRVPSVLYRSPWSAAVTATIGILLSATAAQAELQVVEEQTGQGQLTIYKMTVTPAGEPTPAMKHRLLPSQLELKPGNAALYYTRAFAEGGIASVWKAITDEHGTDVVYGNGDSKSWYSIESPLGELPLEKVRAAAARFDTIIEQFVARGTLRQDCDWGHNIEELRGGDIFETLLPEVQETRSLSRAIMLRTRVAIAEGDYDRAIDHLKMNYRLAQNVAAAPFLVSGLVGIAEASMGNAQAIELIAAKDSPNLYWALASVPRPFIDLQPSVQFELGNGVRVFPFLEDPADEHHTPEEWARLLVKGLTEMQTLGGGRPPQPEWVLQAGVTAMAVVGYTDAKQRLVDGGMTADRVEQMPVGQVVAIDAAREYRRIADKLEICWYLPYGEAEGCVADVDQALVANNLTANYGQTLAGLLLPALGAVKKAQSRLDWQFNALQTVEALRMHADLAGSFPESLDEIAVAYVPNNPVTGKPYNYRLDGDTAVLELPFDDGFNVAWRFEIKLAE